MGGKRKERKRKINKETTELLVSLLTGSRNPSINQVTMAALRGNFWSLRRRLIQPQLQQGQPSCSLPSNGIFPVTISQSTIPKLKENQGFVRWPTLGKELAAPYSFEFDLQKPSRDRRREMTQKAIVWTSYTCHGLCKPPFRTCWRDADGLAHLLT